MLVRMIAAVKQAGAAGLRTAPGRALLIVGLAPDAGGTFFLTQTIGAARARGLAMLAEPLSAEQAEGIGDGAAALA